MTDQTIAISLKRFLLLTDCPADWRAMDLYLFRDDDVAFYVGQSHFAFGRVWDHLLGGFHGHSMVGRFVWCNWPRSMSFTVELLGSGSPQFAGVGSDLNAAERQLIQHWSPCFNLSLNPQPGAVPKGYVPYNGRMRCSRSLARLVHQARRAVQEEDRRRWMQELE
jgi:hypothetical protein